MPRPSDPSARLKLLAAAEAVFVARGLDGAKVEEITRRAGLAKGSFYRHFASKDDAFKYLIEAMVAQLAAYLDDTPGDCPERFADIEGFLDFWVSNDVRIFELIWHNRGVFALLLEGGRCASYRHLVDEFADRARLKVRAFLDSAVRVGLYRGDLDLDLTSAFIAGAYDRLARQIVRERHQPDLRAMLRQVQFLVLRGVASAATLSALERTAVPLSRKRQIHNPNPKKTTRAKP
jgi:TetR/AcrR family transcriptional regulator